ncbi:hypothetical protein STIAU_3634, partial [Stigmatella aurantiaca DW4/3-1]
RVPDQLDSLMLYSRLT